ncbi:MAG: hypothetical protein WCT33_03885 [Patescibacteria group bacterium]|jgi:hypothetical protein
MNKDTNQPAIVFKNKKTPGGVLANIELVFGGIHKIKGFKIIASKYNSSGYAVIPPKTENIGGRGSQWFYFCEDKDVWDELQDTIISRYLGSVFTEPDKT